jgi:dolichol-phosphate mannosyltransferase
MLSVVIPAHNEEGHLRDTVLEIVRALEQDNIVHEILVVNDNSTDNTESVLRDMSDTIKTFRYVNNAQPAGFGRAIRKGLEEYKGDAVIITMADSSDSPQDLVAFYKKFQEGYDCVFGSRFMKGNRTTDYPKFKFILNRMGNFLIKTLFSLGYDDITNAFKCYSRKVIHSVMPLQSNHFNVTVEIPVKAILSGFSYAVLPNSWTNRKHGVSKLNLKKMCSQYLLIVLFLLLHKRLSRS